MKLRSAVVWTLQVAGGARWQPRICGRDPDMQGVVGRLSDMQGVVGHLLDTYGVAGRHFAIFRALSVRISPENARPARMPRGGLHSQPYTRPKASNAVATPSSHTGSVT